MSFFKNMKIGPRLSVSFAIPMVLLIVAIVLGLSALKRVGEAQGQVATAQAIRVAAEDTKYQRYLTRFEIRQYALKGKAADRALELSAADALNADLSKISALAEGDSELSTLTERLKGLSATINQRNAFQLEAISKDPEGMLAALRGKASAGLSQDVSKSLTENNVSIPQEVDALTSLDQLTATRVQQAQDAFGAILRFGIMVAIIAGLAAIVIGIVVVIVFGRSITRPLSKAVAIADAIAGGDLTGTIEVTTSDEIGLLLVSIQTMQSNLIARAAADKAITEDMDRMVNACIGGDLTARIDTAGKDGATKNLIEGINRLCDLLLDVVTQMQDASGAVNIAVQQIAAGNADLAQRTEEQASSLEETAASMEEFTSTVKQNDENARQANQLAIGASDTATRGGEVVGQVVATMASINDSARKIVDIISVIDGIAFQTNILALNAAVEAARAGEQGRGFAVVAGEVRNLAQRSANAAKEIKTLISTSVDKTEAGSRQVNAAGKTMAEIVQSVKRVTDIMSEMAAASREQLTGIEQVNSAVMQMDQMTQQNAALVEQAATAAESLEDQASKLVESVSIFKTGNTTAAPIKVQRVTDTHSRNAREPKRPARQLARVSGNGHSQKAKTNESGDWETF